MNFKKWWKELWCSHIFQQDGDKEFLRKVKEDDSIYVLGIGYDIQYNTYEYYAIRSCCIKCGKKKVEEERCLII